MSIQSGPLTGMVAIVTGAGRGIGRAEAVALARYGASVLVNDCDAIEGTEPKSSGSAQQTVDEIVAAGGVAVANGEPVSTLDAGGKLVEAALDCFGRLDIVVNNAGVSLPALVEDIESEALELMIGVHLRGYIGLLKAVSPVFRRQNSGLAINTSSHSGLGHWGNSVYGLLKEGVVGLTRTVAREFGTFGARCVAIRPIAASQKAQSVPFLVETIRYQQEVLKIPAVGDRWVGPAEFDALPAHIGEVVAWLATPGSPRFNGLTFGICGGEFAIYSDPQPGQFFNHEGGWTVAALQAAIPATLASAPPAKTLGAQPELRSGPT